ncbi:MAG: Rieske 2Fe-2S domain-containing protein [Thermomicrobiales bacterium]|nr:Rieske 2Fe-2S domain-containing protein [Thermomicrobiales bacterium]MCA9877330.1 Rieske 2Fe-2S domain-containing protein [Thermomicrobiales bacterium]
MFKIVRTVFGLVVGWVVSAIMGLLGRYHSQGSLTVRPDRRQFVRNATLGAVGTVLTLGAAGFLGLLWPRKTGAFGSELTVKAENVPPVDGTPYHNIQGKFYLVHNSDGLLALYTKCPHLGCSVPYVGPVDSPEAFKCPCHGSMYDYDGVRTGGPAPRPMDIMAVTVDEATGNVLVNTGDISQREDYAPSQAAPYAV